MLYKTDIVNEFQKIILSYGIYIPLEYIIIDKYIEQPRKSGKVDKFYGISCYSDVSEEWYQITKYFYFTLSSNFTHYNSQIIISFTNAILSNNGF